jgi:hypothetical protein
MDYDFRTAQTGWGRTEHIETQDQTFTLSQDGRFAIISRRYSMKPGASGPRTFWTIWSEKGKLHALDNATMRDAKDILKDDWSEYKLDKLPPKERLLEGYPSRGEWRFR